MLLHLSGAKSKIYSNSAPAGHEQVGPRPALVFSPAAYNAKPSLMICYSIRTQIKHYLFEVLVAGTRENFVLADQFKSLD